MLNLSSVITRMAQNVNKNDTGCAKETEILLHMQTAKALLFLYTRPYISTV